MVLTLINNSWEHRKLGDVTSVATFKPYLKEINEDGEYEIIQQGDKPLAGYANGNPFQDYEKVTLFGDHTFSLYKAKAPFFVASDGVKILFSKDMNGYFYYYLLENYKPQSEGYKRHFSILKECECSYPTNIIEQQKIGEYFSNLDNLITLHQRERSRKEDTHQWQKLIKKSFSAPILKDGSVSTKRVQSEKSQWINTS